MITEDITLQQAHNNLTGEVPLKAQLKDLAMGLSVIHARIVGLEEKNWLDEATDLARGEMISDVDEVAAEVRKEIEKAKKLIPFRYRYFINPIKGIWQLRLK